MKLDFYNCPQPQKIDPEILPKERPAFLDYAPDFAGLEKISEKYEEFKNILIIAHGGSLTTFYGFYHALKYQAKKKAYFLNTTDPDYIHELRSSLSPKDTLVLSISKSGENTTHLEATAQFLDYPILVVTGKSSPLRAMAEKLNIQAVMHPPIGGRYTGFTEVSLLPAVMCGFDARGLMAGAKEFFTSFETDNLAWRAASVLWQLEEKGFVDVFMPIYSHYLTPLYDLVIQLVHESFGKDQKGQTYIKAEAPESQHHTNQRFFGGRKNIGGFFTTLENFNHPTKNSFPHAAHSVQIKNHTLSDISNIPLEMSMEYEGFATMEDARINGIPLAHLSVKDMSPNEVGRLTAFWQMYAVYSSCLRQVNPFDQPQVENSKNISFSKRLQFKGLL